jgi:hypothetical protein
MAAAPKFHKQIMKYNENIIAYQLCFSHIRAGDFVSVQQIILQRSRKSISLFRRKRGLFSRLFRAVFVLVNGHIFTVFVLLTASRFRLSGRHNLLPHAIPGAQLMLAFCQKNRYN